MFGSDVHAQVRALELEHREIYESLDPDRIEAWLDFAPFDGAYSDDFGSSASGGRGESYVAAQRATFNRVTGITAILDIVGQRTAASPLVVDLLGGDGLISRVAAALGRTESEIVTCDASPFMVEAAWAAGIPALLQYAQFPLFRAGSVGGVILAYGTHHIPPQERATVVKEAHTILQPGGVFVLHDFLVGSAMERWFGEVVDVHSVTGHRHSHFDRADIESYLQAAGFAEIDVMPLDDPFVVRAPSAAAAELAMGRHLVEMYGLTRLVEEYGETGAYRRAHELGRAIFRDETAGRASGAEPYYAADLGAWTLTLGRSAVVGRGVA
ncbi:methyltransferase domain-containing protein [Marinactinospora rubrisoli]|uniref:methyltransferase domain-containing protein n=1 Tax=Marinactinospora rubrisoli TaxID=2715399 RepID=UPI0036D41ACD